MEQKQHMYYLIKHPQKKEAQFWRLFQGRVWLCAEHLFPQREVSLFFFLSFIILFYR